jgi:ribosomal protein S18 acetylase RimI-like enzyme
VSSAFDVLVRDVRPAERGAVGELTLSAYAEYAAIMEPSAWSLLRQAIVSALAVDNGAQWIVAEGKGRVLGSVLLFAPSADAYGVVGPRTPWPELRLLAVAPEARGLGVGRLLVNECTRRAKAIGAEAIGLHTSRSMRDAIRLYEALGFQRDPEHDIRVEGAEPIDAYRLPLDA